MSAIISLEWNRHKHLLWGRQPVYATPDGLIGGGWDVPGFVEEWRAETGIGPIEYRVALDGADRVSFEMFHNKKIEAVFRTQEDAFMFKMKWL